MSKEVDLTPEQALERAHKAISDPVLAQLGIVLSDPEDAAVRIALSLADAASPDALLADAEAAGWEAQEGRSLLVRSAEYLPSTKPGGLGIYVIATVVDVDTGEQLVLTSGATNVVIQVAKLLKEGWTDRPVKLRIRATSSGNPVHRLIVGDPGDTVPFD